MTYFALADDVRKIKVTINESSYFHIKEIKISTLASHIVNVDSSIKSMTIGWDIIYDTQKRNRNQNYNYYHPLWEIKSPINDILESDGLQ